MALRVLHLEDSQLDADLIRQHLRRGRADAEVTWARDRASYEAALGSGAFDLILSDFAVPQYSGELALDLAHQACPDTPFIFISGVLGEDIAVEMLKRGATDYVVKSRLERLIPAVSRALAEAHERTERRRAEHALRESESRFRVMADAAPVLIWIADAHGGRSWFNEPWTTFAGRSATDDLGEGWLERVHPADVSEVRRRVHEAAVTRAPVRHEYRLRRADGQFRWILEHMVPTGNGEAGFIGSGVDVTELHEVREALSRSNEELNRLVAERTAALEQSHERLRAAERMAALGTLSAGIGHDIGNLLLPMRVHLDTLESSPLPEQNRRDVEGIRHAADYLNKLAYGLRLLSIDPAATSGKQPETSLQGWWPSVEPLFRHQLPRHVRLTSAIPADLPLVRVQPAALSQAVFNLVQNAGDALAKSPHGSVHIGATLGGDGRVRLTVTDDGPGMTAEVRKHCTDPFFTTKTRAASTGLGLALVHGIAAQCGGELAIESEPGRGTTVTFALPARREDDSETMPQTVAALTLSDPRRASFVAALLQNAGYAVERAIDAPREDALLWVVSGEVASEERIGAFLARDGRARVIVLGGNEGELQERNGVIVVPGAWKATDLRAALRAAREEQALT